MKKSVVLVCALCILLLAVSSATAAPAPRLSKVKINAFTAQNYNYQWKAAPGGYPKSMSAYSFSGPELYMNVLYSGYPNWNTTFITINGTQVTHSEVLERQLPITNRGVIVGFEVFYKIPAAYLGASSNIAVNASGTNGSSASDVATNIRFAK